MLRLLALSAFAICRESTFTEGQRLWRGAAARLSDISELKNQWRSRRSGASSLQELLLALVRTRAPILNRNALSRAGWAFPPVGRSELTPRMDIPPPPDSDPPPESAKEERAYLLKELSKVDSDEGCDVDKALASIARLEATTVPGKNLKKQLVDDVWKVNWGSDAESFSVLQIEGAEGFGKDLEEIYLSFSADGDTFQFIEVIRTYPFGRYYANQLRGAWNITKTNIVECNAEYIIDKADREVDPPDDILKREIRITYISSELMVVRPVGEEKAIVLERISKSDFGKDMDKLNIKLRLRQTRKELQER
mmetsp:Transcript_98802/g.156270  ORF Transcript_98802/g.156270 Transcript_98802/m.156270 type:complete len:309 (+) Transcript_98802:35-961(+)